MGQVHTGELFRTGGGSGATHPLAPLGAQALAEMRLWGSILGSKKKISALCAKIRGKPGNGLDPTPFTRGATKLEKPLVRTACQKRMIREIFTMASLGCEGSARVNKIHAAPNATRERELAPQQQELEAS